MKTKTLLAAVASTLALPALAQSSVTIFGVIDANYQHASQGGASVNRVNGSGGNQISRLGFRGIEDLGGGLSASFVLDMGLNIDTGTGGLTTTNNQTTTGSGITFNRRSTVSLTSKTLGELRIGRDFTPTYWNLTAFDPFGTAGAGSASSIIQSNISKVSTVQTALRASNSVGYFLPQGKGLYGQLMYAMGEKPSNAPNGTRKDGNYAGLRIGYADANLHVALAHGRTSLTSGDVTTTNAGAAYAFGSVKPMVQIFEDRKDNVATPNRSSGFLVGAQFTLGPGYIPVSYSQIHDNASVERKAQLLAIGYVHNLSKRTAVYTTVSRIANSGGASVSGGGVTGVANAAWKGVDIGIRHSF